MSDEHKEDTTFWERAQETFKVVVLDDETLQQVRSYRLSRMNVYTIIASVFLIMAAIILSLFFFTPARKLVPGFGDIEENGEFLQLKIEMDTLEQIVHNQQVYINSMRTLLSGESTESIPSIDAGNILTESSDNVKVSGAQVKETTRSLKLDQLAFVPPVRGTISSSYAPELDHQGVDIVAIKDSPILSTMEGMVISSDWTLETGNTIIIQHPFNILSIYKHNSALLKKTGDKVEAGEAIAIIGNTGELSSGPHLHFELWYGGQHVDPALYVRL